MKKDDRPGREFVQKKLYELSYYAEVIISVVIFIIIAIGLARIVVDILNPELSWYSDDALNYFLNRALALAVATEFVKMLCRHSASSVIEVLLFATARQMVVEHYAPLQTLVSVAAISGLFATRKFLLSRKDIKDDENTKKEEALDS